MKQLLLMVAALTALAGYVGAAPVGAVSYTPQAVDNPVDPGLVVMMVVNGELTDVTNQTTVYFDDGHVFIRLNSVEVGVLVNGIIYNFEDEAIGYVSSL